MSRTMMLIRRKHLHRNVVRRLLISTRDIVVVAGDGGGTSSRFIYECCFGDNNLDVELNFTGRLVLKWPVCV